MAPSREVDGGPSASTGIGTGRGHSAFVWAIWKSGSRLEASSAAVPKGSTRQQRAVAL